MKILIISFYFPPYNTIGAVRIGKLAEYWLEQGHDVKVITALDQPLLESLPSKFPKEHVFYTDWLNINRLPEMVLGKRKVVTQGYTSKNSLLGKFGKLYKSFLNFPDGQIGWFFPALGAGKNLIKRDWQPDLIYASAKPFTSLLIAKMLASRYQIPWVAELRDLWTANHYYEYSRARRLLESRLEEWVLSGAEMLVTVSEPLANKLRVQHKQTVITVPNGFDPDDYQETIAGILPEDKLNLVYTGMAYEVMQDPSPLFRALADFSERNKVRVHFYGRYLSWVQELVKSYGLEDIVSISEAVPFSMSVALQMQSDILLLLLWNDPAETGVYTGKIFEYFGARHPILAIGKNADVAGCLIEERGAGVVTNDSKVIAASLSKWLEQKFELHEPFVLDEDVSKGLTRQDQFRILDHGLTSAGILRR